MCDILMLLRISDVRLLFFSVCMVIVIAIYSASVLLNPCAVAQYTAEIGS